MRTESVERAQAAAEELAAQGVAVTARAVRLRSGVKMALANDVARGWNERQRKLAEMPEIPATLLVRARGIWLEAVTMARDEFASERESVAIEIEKSQQKTHALEVRIKGLESQRDSALRSGEQASGRADVFRSRADKAEAQVIELRKELAETQERLVCERSRADRAEARAEAAVEIAQSNRNQNLTE